MKKFKAVLCAFLLTFFLTNSAFADLYVEVVDVGAIAAATYPFYNGGFHVGDTAGVQIAWTFDTPLDFSVPFDIVNSATVDVEVGWVDTFGDDFFQVYDFDFSPFIQIPLTQNTATYTLDVGSLFVSWNPGGTVFASLSIQELLSDGDVWEGDIRLYNSTFTLDYEQGSAPVPEPSTLLLMGAGILGLVGYNRKRFSKTA